MWHLTFLVPAQAVLSLTSVRSFPSSRCGDSWTRSVFTVRGEGSSFFFEARQCFGLGGGRGVRDGGEEMPLLCQLTWLGLTWDVATAESGFRELRASGDGICPGCTTAFTSLTWPFMEVLLWEAGVLSLPGGGAAPSWCLYEKNKVWERLSVCISALPIL